MANGRGGEWTVVDFERTATDVPMETFRASLTDPRHIRDTAALVLQLKARGNQLGEPKSAKVADGLYELRGFQVRIFYTFLPGRVIVLLYGVIKKQDKL